MTSPLLKLVGIALVIALAVFAGCQYSQEAQKAADSALRASIAELQVADAMRAATTYALQRDSALDRADSLGRLRVVATGKARQTIASLGPEPEIQPDTCKQWIERARLAEKGARESIIAMAQAEIEVDDLRDAIRNDSLALQGLRAAANAALPVLVEHSTVKIPQNGGRKFLGVPLPALTLGYGAVLSCMNGCSIHHGPGVSLGWQIRF